MTASSDRLLRRTLWGNAAFSVVSGAMLAVLAGPFARAATDAPVSVLGLDLAILFELLGVGVVAFGALSDRIGRRPILMAGTLGVFFLCVPGVALLWDPSDAWRVYLAQILAIVPVSAIGATAWKKRSFTSILRTM